MPEILHNVILPTGGVGVGLVVAYLVTRLDTVDIKFRFRKRE